MCTFLPDNTSILVGVVLTILSIGRIYSNFVLTNVLLKLEGGRGDVGSTRVVGVVLLEDAAWDSQHFE